LSPYRPNQGVHARGAAAGALLVLALFASVRLYNARPLEASFRWLGLTVSQSVVLAGGLFIALGAIILLLTVGPNTGIAGIDKRVHGVIDLLIETQSELQKVSWPSGEELSRSTTAVLVSIVLLGAALFVIDLVWAFVMKTFQVLPG